MDELFEALTLIQCQKIEKPVPTILYGKDFWENVVGWDKFIEAGTISKKDLNLFKIVDDVEIFHAGTKNKDNKIVTSGGRVLNINGYGKNLVDAKEKAYNLVKKINWPGYYYRKDIGWRALKE